LVAVRSVNARLDGWLEGASPEVEGLDGRAFVTDALIAGLRLVDGIDLVVLSDRAGVDVLAEHRVGIERAGLTGLVEMDRSVLRATEAGLAVLDQTTAVVLDLA
jgi:coproporphyrinogen III oxidase-like Fe-S oxidoreductase